MEVIGLFAGGGQFPLMVARAVRGAGKRVVVCGFTGHTDASLETEADSFGLFPMGQFGAILRFLRMNGVTRLCMAGRIAKPRVMELRPDAMAMRLLFSLRNNCGDDALLRGVIRMLADEGVEVLSAADLVPSLRCPEGVLGKVPPRDEVRDALTFGWPRLATLGGMDIGQCMVVRDGIVVAVECLEGTDATLRRAGSLGVPGCVALKMAKPRQDVRVDLPSVGLGTMEILADGRYAGLILQAGQTLFFDREKAVAMADAAGICIWAVTPRDVAGL